MEMQCIVPVWVTVFIVLGLYNESISSNTSASFSDATSSPRKRVTRGDLDGYIYTPGVGIHRIHKLSRNWRNARKICRREGGDLAVINSQAESQALAHLIAESYLDYRLYESECVLIGFNDRDHEGKHVTVDGRSLAEAGYAKWGPDEPNNEGGTEDCGSVRKDGLLNDVGCGIKAAFACELPLVNAGMTGRKPLMTPSGEQMVIQEGDQLTISCQGERGIVFSTPKSTTEAKWLENETVLYNQISRTYTLKRPNVTKEDTGWYACAEHGIGILNDEQTIDHPKSEISWIYVYVNSSAPFAVASDNPIPIPVVVGRSAVIPCRPTTPNLHVGLESSASEAVPADWQYDPKIGYIIKEVAQTQNGTVYECTNDETYRTNFTRSLYTLQISEAGVTTGGDVRVRIGNPATLWCHVKGFSLSNFSWAKIVDSKNIRHLKNKGSFTFVNSTYAKMSLDFTSVTREDNGTYECNAIESIGGMSEYIQMIVTEVPEVKVDDVRPVGNDSVYLSWTVYDGNDRSRSASDQPVQITSRLHSGIYSFPLWPRPLRYIRELRHRQPRHRPGVRDRVFPQYTVMFSQPQQFADTLKECHLRMFTNKKSSCLISELEKNRTYRFTIRVTNTIGVSLPAVSNWVTTFDKDPQFIPKIWILETSDTSITIGWSVASEEFRHIFQYYKMRVTDSRGTKDLGDLTAGSGYTIRGYLETGNKYSIKVAACNNYTNRCGDWSAEIETTAIDRDPKFVPNITLVESTIHSIKINWSTPPPELQDRVFQYKVVAEMVQEKTKDQIYVPGFANSYTFQNVTPKTTYLVKVAACSEYETQCGRWSPEEEAFTIGAGLDPNYVVEPSIHGTSNTTIAIGWPKLPENLLDYVHCYKINATQENDTEGRAFVGYTDVGSTSDTITGLETGMNYSVKVAVCSNCGNRQNCSNWSREIKTDVRSRDPTFVPNVTLEEVTFQSIRINWTMPPPELEDRVHQYKVVAKTGEEKTTDPVYVPRTKNRHTFENLKTKTTYLVKVAACSEYEMQCADWGSEKVFTSSKGEDKGVDVKLLVGLVITVLLLFGVATWAGIRRRGERASKRRFITAAIEVFKSGAVKSLDPKLTIADQAELLPYDKKWEFPRKLLRLDEVLGSGAFGVVKKGYAESISRKQIITTVAVKMVRATQSLEHMTALQRELKILGNLGKHLNVVNLLGACTKRISYGSLLVIVEFCRFGNLHDYLLRRRGDFVDGNDLEGGNIAGSSCQMVCWTVNEESLNTADSDPDYVTGECGRSRTLEGMSFQVDDSPSHPDTDDVEPGLISKYRVDFTGQDLKPIGPWDLLSWAWQVSKGMKYIGSKKVLHGDLAARNILLTDNKVVKICDFGLARSLYTNDIYKKEGQGPLPIKWMAIESIKDRLFSIKSDVWSYGVVLWEFYSLAETPYPGISNENVYQKLIDGFRMEQPKYATDDMYNMMLRCWNADPSERPSFEEIENIIHDLLDDGVKKHYHDLDAEYAKINADSLSNQGPDVLAMSPAEYTSFMTQPRDDPALNSPEGTTEAEAE